MKKKVTKTIQKLPKKSNAKSGVKAHNDNIFYKVGKIRYNSWATKVLRAYDIVVSERELLHIQNNHYAELEQLGMTAFDFVKYIFVNFNEIYAGKDGSQILVVKREKLSQRAIVELILVDKKYRIKTATPIETKRLYKMKLLLSNFCKVGY